MRGPITPQAPVPRPRQPFRALSRHVALIRLALTNARYPLPLDPACALAPAPPIDHADGAASLQMETEDEDAKAYGAVHFGTFSNSFASMLGTATGFDRSRPSVLLSLVLALLLPPRPTILALSPFLGGSPPRSLAALPSPLSKFSHPSSCPPWSIDSLEIPHLLVHDSGCWSLRLLSPVALASVLAPAFFRSWTNHMRSMSDDPKYVPWWTQVPCKAL